MRTSAEQRCCAPIVLTLSEAASLHMCKIEKRKMQRFVRESVLSCVVGVCGSKETVYECGYKYYSPDTWSMTINILSATVARFEKCHRRGSVQLTRRSNPQDLRNQI